MNYFFFSIGTALFFALTFALRKEATKFVSAPTALVMEVAVQFAILTILFFILAPEFRKGATFETKGLYLAAIAGVTVAIGVACNYLALKTGTLSRIVTIISPTQIIFGIVIGVIFFKDVLTAKQVVGIVLGIISVILMAV